MGFNSAFKGLMSRFSVRECLVYYNSITTRGGTIGPMALDDTT